MYTKQFGFNSQFSLDFLPLNQRSRCSLCLIPFRSREHLFAKGSKVTLREFSTPKVVILCPICTATVYRFSETFSFYENALKPEDVLQESTAISVYSPAHQDHVSIVKTVVNLSLMSTLIQNVESFTSVHNPDSITVTGKVITSIQSSKKKYEVFQAVLEKQIFGDNALKYLQSSVHLEIGEIIKASVFSSYSVDLDNICVSATPAFIEWLISPKIGALEVDSVLVWLGLNLKMKNNSES